MQSKIHQRRQQTFFSSCKLCELLPEKKVQNANCFFIAQQLAIPVLVTRQRLSWRLLLDLRCPRVDQGLGFLEPLLISNYSSNTEGTLSLGNFRVHSHISRPCSMHIKVKISVSVTDVATAICCHWGVESPSPLIRCKHMMGQDSLEGDNLHARKVVWNRLVRQGKGAGAWVKLPHLAKSLLRLQKKEHMVLWDSLPNSFQGHASHSGTPSHYALVRFKEEPRLSCGTDQGCSLRKKTSLGT